MIVQFPGQNLVTYLADRFQALFIQFSQPVIGNSRGFFKNCECPYDLHWDFFNTYLKILEASLCLSAPVPVGRNFNLSHGIMLQPVIHLKALPSYSSLQSLKFPVPSWKQGSV